MNIHRAYAPWAIRRHELLGDLFLSRCAQNGVTPPPVLWMTSDDGTETKCLILWSDEDADLVEGSVGELPWLVFNAVQERSVDRN